MFLLNLPRMWMPTSLHGAAAQVWPWHNPGNTHLAHIALHTLAVDWRKVRMEQHGQLARAIKRMGRVDLVDAMLDRHFLQRWRFGLIVQAPAADREQLGLGVERERVSVVLNQRAPLA